MRYEAAELSAGIEAVLYLYFIVYIFNMLHFDALTYLCIRI